MYQALNNKKAHRVVSDHSNRSAAATTEIIWKDVNVGDMILIRCDEEIPADCAVIACGGIQVIQI